MSRYLFLFDLDSTIVRQEIWLNIAKKYGVYEQMRFVKEHAQKGEVPFKQDFLRRIELVKNIPVSEVKKEVSGIELNEVLVDFIRANRDRCFIVTENLDVWIEDLLKKIGMERNVFCSKALVKDDCIQDVLSVVDKNAVISQMVLSFVAVGAGNNDSEMIEAAEIGIGYGGQDYIAPSVLSCASHAVYDENKLVDFLNKLL